MFGFQIKKGEEWLWVSSPTYGPYKYATEEKAAEMMSICYPDQIRTHRLGGEQTVRVMEIKENNHEPV